MGTRGEALAEINHGGKRSAIDRLRQELWQTLGTVERQILKKVDLKDFVPDDTSTAHHLDILRGLVSIDTELGTSLINHMLTETGLTVEDLERVIIERFTLEDLSFEIGSKRKVDRVILELVDKCVAVLTASLDIEPVSNIEASPSWQEARTLADVNFKKAWCVQECYGYATLEDERGTRVLICKEFIPGQMLENFFVDFSTSLERHGAPYLQRVAYTVGKMVANALTELGGIPRDSTPMNIIIDEDTEGGIIARYCDVEDIRRDTRGISWELHLIASDLGAFAVDMERGIQEHYTGNLGPLTELKKAA